MPPPAPALAVLPPPPALVADPGVAALPEQAATKSPSATTSEAPAALDRDMASPFLTQAIVGLYLDAEDRAITGER